MKDHRMPQRTLLKNYQRPEYLIHNVALEFDIQSNEVLVRSTLSIKLIHENVEKIFLNGDQLTLLSIKINGKPLIDIALLLKGR